MTTSAIEGSLLRHRPYWRWSAGAQFARLPSAVAPLAFTLLTTATTGSYRLGGVMMAVFVVAELLGAVPCGRLLDRLGPVRGLTFLLAGAAAGLGGLALAAVLGAPGPVLLALVVVPGLAGGGVSGGFRALLAATVSPPLLPRAIAVDMTVVEGVLVAGPLIASLAALLHPALPVVVMALAFLAALALMPRVRLATSVVPPTGVRLRASAWLASVYAIGHLLSTIEVAPLPLVERLGAGPGAAPLVPAVLCVASMAGGALYAWRGSRLRWSPRAQAATVLGVFVVGGVTVMAATGWTGLLAGVVLVGAGTAPLGTIASVELQRTLPPDRRAEGFSLAFAAQASGFALGSLSVGILPVGLAIVFGVLAAALACAMLVRRSGRTVGSAPATS